MHLRGDATAQPLVSVILPVRDRSDCVTRAIRSVLDQGYPRLELIVIDDGSRDGTASAAATFGDALRLIRQPGRGVAAARNRGLAEARGELIAFIDSDDFWYPDKLSRQVPLFEDADVGLVFADVRHVSRPEAGAPPTGTTSFDVAPPPRNGTAASFAFSNFVPTSAAMARRTVLIQLGGFPSMLVSEDYPVWVDISLSHDLAYIDACLADYTIHPAGISQNLERLLDARLGIFANKAQAGGDPEAQRLFRHIAFNGALSLLAAAVRGKASGRTARKALATIIGHGRLATVFWLVQFILVRWCRGSHQPSDRAVSIRSMKK